MRIRDLRKTSAEEKRQKTQEGTVFFRMKRFQDTGEGEELWSFFLPLPFFTIETGCFSD